MKRALAFLLVLTAGGAMLFWADKSSRARMSSAAEKRPGSEAAATAKNASAPAESTTPAPVSSPVTSPGSSPGPQDDKVILRGRVKTQLYPSGPGAKRPTHELNGRFEPQDELGLRYLVHDLELENFEGGGAAEMTVTAKRSRFSLHREKEEGAQFARYELVDDGRIDMEEVTIIRHRGHPLAPLEFTAPALTLWLERDQFESTGDGVVTMRGLGLQAEGRGMTFDGTSGRFALERGGEVRIDREGQDPIVFRSAPEGMIELSELVAENELQLRASGGAALITRATPNVRVDAQDITLRGFAEEDSFRVADGRAKGKVTARRGEENYRGETARLFMDESGHLTRSVLDEEPYARFAVGDTFVIARGAGPLTAWMTDAEERRFLLVGPGTAEVEGSTLEINAEGSLEGIVAADDQTGVVQARTGVVVTQEDSRLDAESLDALLFAKPNSIQLTCIGATRLTSRTKAGNVVTIDAKDEAQVDVTEAEWKVPVARGVLVHVLGDEPMRMEAGVVTDVDPIAVTMEMTEGVSWVGVAGEADASRALVTGEQSAEFFGIPGSPARLRLLPGRSDDIDTTIELANISALHIDVAPGRVEARDAVSIRTEDPENRAGIDASLVVVTYGEEEDPAAPVEFSLEAEDVSSFLVPTAGGGMQRVRCGRLTLGGWIREGEFEVSWAIASGGVEVEQEGPPPLFAKGERLVFQGGIARLVGAEGERIEFWTLESGEDPAWRFEADALTFGEDDLWVDGPQGTYHAPLLPGRHGRAIQPSQVPPCTVRAEGLRLEQGRWLFSGSVFVQGSDDGGIPIKLEAGELLLKGSGGPSGMEVIESFEARRNFHLVYGGLALARGQRATVTEQFMTLQGSEERRAVFDVGGTALTSSWLEIDLERFLVTSERGELVASQENGGWSLGYAALRPIERDGETIIVLVAPRYDDGSQLARADHAAIWLHGEEWRRRGREALFGKPRELDETPVTDEVAEEKPAGQRRDLVQNIFASQLQGNVSKLVQSAHIEGSLEVTENQRTVARASQAWLDLERQRGWLEDATLVAHMDLSGVDRTGRVRVRSAKVISRGDGSLQAANATLTTSTHDVPGYVIQTGELVLAPRDDGMWSFSAKPNRIRFKNGLTLPLPPLGNLVLDDTGDFVGFETDSGEVRTIENITLGDTARHGTEVGTKVRFPIGKWGRKIAQFFGFSGTRMRGDWATEGSYLSNRGVLVGVGLDLRERDADGDDFWFKLFARGIEDGGADRGLVRVDEADRDSLRTWIFGRGRYPLEPGEWLGMQFSTQSDPAVQAEFYEGEYQRYERRENDVYWRKAFGSNYADARVVWRGDSFRSEVEEMPSVGLYGGERTIAELGPVPILWGGDFDASYVRRREGDLNFEDPFYDSFGSPDGLGDREALRATTSQRISAPLRTGVAGLIATPWVEGRASVWDEGVNPDESPRRSTVLAGLDLATTLLKRTTAGYLHTLSPTLSVRTDLSHEEEHGAPVRFDEFEDSLEGDEASVGLRAMWTHPERPHSLDVSVQAQQRRDRGAAASYDRIALLSEYRTEVFDRPFALVSDLRINPDDGRTAYGFSTAAIAPTDDWLFQLSHRRGRGTDGLALFESATVQARWTIDPKWELQLGQGVNLLGSGTLHSEFIIRRYGADFLFELEILDRAGEGGTTVRVNFAPMFAWKRKPLTILEQRAR